MRVASCFWANRLSGLIVKETLHTLRDKHLLFLLIFPPTVQLLILGASLDIGVKHVPIGIVDFCNTRISHELIDTITAGDIFYLKSAYLSEQSMDMAIRASDVKAGIVIPDDFENTLDREHVAKVKVWINGVDAYTARIAQGYLLQMFAHFRVAERAGTGDLVSPAVTILFNPGLLSSWYFVPGVIGAMLTLTSTLVSGASLLREKELGTLEQLLMTPYSVAEILFAKVFPVFVLVMIDVLLALSVALFVFGLPMKGSITIFLFAGALYTLVGLGLGILMATVCKTERQAHLVSFFVNVPVMLLSGAVVPFETMPAILQEVGMFDPLRHFTIISRAAFLKGTSDHSLLTELLMLAASAIILFTLSLLRFRRQLG